MGEEEGMGVSGGEGTLKEPVFDEKIHYLLTMDLPNEDRKGLSKEQMSWLHNERQGIRNAVVMRYKCRPLQRSVYLVPQKSLEDVRQAMDKWEQEYRAMNYDHADLILLPLRTTHEGTQTFLRLEEQFLLEWVNSIIKQLDSIGKRGEWNRLKQKNLGKLKAKVELIGEVANEDLKGSNRWIEIEDTIMLAQELLGHIFLKRKTNTGREELRD